MTRTDFYLRRVDGHLCGLPNIKAKTDFLNQQLERFEEEYRRFVAVSGEGFPEHPVHGPINASDYVITIGDLSARLSALEQEGMARGDEVAPS